MPYLSITNYFLYNFYKNSRLPKFLNINFKNKYQLVFFKSIHEFVFEEYMNYFIFIELASRPHYYKMEK